MVDMHAVRTNMHKKATNFQYKNDKLKMIVIVK